MFQSRDSCLFGATSSTDRFSGVTYSWVDGTLIATTVRNHFVSSAICIAVIYHSVDAENIPSDMDFRRATFCGFMKY